MGSHPVQGLGAVAAALGKALFPDKCLLCGAFFRPSDAPSSGEPGAFQKVLGDWLCETCGADFEAIESPRCPRCGLPFATEAGGDHLCGDCRTRPGAFERARAVGRYAGALKALILKFKFEGQVGLAAPLGRLLWDTFRRHWSPGDIDLILPVPLHPQRMRRRGYNQAYLLLRHWTGRYAAAAHPARFMRIERDLIRRIRATPPQTGLSRRAREANLKQAFVLDRPLACSGRRILLVDDVLTTGATANGCARALLGAGAQRVEVLTLARAV